VNNCEYHLGSCSLGSLGHVTWPVEVMEACEYLEFKNVTGTLLGESQFLSKDHKIGLTYHNSTSISIRQKPPCPTDIRIADQGVAFSIFKIGMIDITSLKARLTREVGVRRVGLVTSDQLALSEQATVTLTYRNVNELFAEHVTSACKSMSQSLVDLFLGLASHPSETMRSMFNDSYIFAQMSGNMVAVYPCVPVATYRFVNSAVCTSAPPLMFKMPHETD